MITINGIEYFTSKEMITRYPFSKSWFEKARHKNKGFPYIRVGGKVFYPIDECDKWFKSHALILNHNNN